MRESSADNAVRDETVSSSDDDVNHEVCGVISTVWKEGNG